MIGERLGLPSVGIMTDKFVSAAELMARALGAESFRFVVIEHPISSADTAALGERARRAAERCAEILLGTPG